MLCASCLPRPHRKTSLQLTMGLAGMLTNTHIVAICGVALLASISTAQAESAPMQFDWGGEKKEATTGRTLVAWKGAQPVGTVVVSFGDRKLYYINEPGRALAYPIAVPREQDRWQGKSTITDKRENPSWTPTPTMIAENPKLPRWVPGGHPLNPLGNKALYLGSSLYRIHGTDAPWTIGSAVSKGCIRMYNQDVADLYPRVKLGTGVLVTWDKFSLGEVIAEPERAKTEVVARSSQARPADKVVAAAKRPTGSLQEPERARPVTQTTPATRRASPSPVPGRPRVPSPELIDI